MTKRRYSEEEVEAIFERAAAAQQSGPRQLPSGEGMTLAELQEIGREVGIPPEIVSRAAKTMDQVGQPAARKFIGMPIGVGRTVELSRRLTEEEWERLVVDLRETFDARGKVRVDGSFRQWTNGNLQALLEPTPTGNRLRLRTFKSSARAMMTGGAVMLGGAIVTLIGSIGEPGSIASVASLAAWGLGLFGFGALSLPSWARQRQSQMEGVAERLALAIQPDPEDSPPDDV